MFESVRYLLLQVRNSGDPMRRHEVESFARGLKTVPERVRVFDLLGGALTDADLAGADVVLLGGSGHYSATGEGPWLERALDSLRRVHGSGRPTFASCWGFQAMARALGGRVVHDPARAELGTHRLHLTDAGKDDPVFGPLGSPFLGQMGHEDCVDELPPGATLLASSARLRNQAYRFDDRPIYCTQFHPELNRSDMLLRVRNYPDYIRKIAGIPLDQFAATLSDTPDTEALLRRFVAWALGSR